MKILSTFRRYVVFACSLVALLGLATPAFATHLRGGTVTWRVTNTTATTYTVQFTLIESSRWSYPGTAGSCGTSSQQTNACPALNSSVNLNTLTGGTFYFGDGAVATPSGTVTSINQAQDYLTATFVFSRTYNNSQQNVKAYFTASNRISTLKIGHDQPEYIYTIVANYANGSPSASTPAILAVPLLSTTTFNIATAVTDIDPNVNLVYRVATLAELYGPNVTSIPCPSGPAYSSPAPPGFTVSSAGEVTWNTALIATSVTGGNCGFGTPAAGDLWPAQIMVEAHDKTSGALVTETPIDFLMNFVSPVGALPTVKLNPAGTQTVAIGTPVAFTATANSSNANAKVTLNASGIPSGATASGLNAAVTPPSTSNFNWTPASGQDGTYVVTYTVTDDNLQQATASNTIVVATLPTISCAAPLSVPFGQLGTLTAKVFDINQDLLNVAWSVDGTNVQTNSNVTAYPNPATVQLQQTFGNAGVHPVKVTATDPHGVAVFCNTSVTVYQPTSLALASASGTVGNALALSATLTTVSGGTPVAGQTVTFSFTGTGAPSSTTAVTDVNGVATASVVFPTAGSFTATASFLNSSGFFTDSAGDIPPVADTAGAQVTVAKATTSLSALNAPSVVSLGNSLTVSTTLSRVSAPAGPLAGQTVVFTFTAPGGAVTTVSGNTDVNGLATVTSTPSVVGVYNISAQFAGTGGLAGTSSGTTVTVYQRTSLAISSASGTAGSAVTLSASLTAFPSGTPLANQTVTFSFTGTGAPSSTTAVTDANGVATASVVFATAGSFTATASFSNLGGFFSDSNGNLTPDTASAPVTVASATTSLSALNAPATALVGNSLTVSTTLNRVSAPAGAVSGVPIVFTLTAPGGAVTTLSGNTDVNGLATVAFTPTTGGVNNIAAQFAGTDALQAATTPTTSVTVYQRTSLALASASGTAGSALTLNATLTTVPAGVPLAGQTVTFSFAGTGAPSQTTAVTNANGVATASVVFATAGSFTASATFSNPSGFFADSTGAVPVIADTASAPVTVASATTSLSALQAPSFALVGGSLTVSTTLNRVSAPAGAVSGVPVIFTLTAPGGALTTLSGTTDANGLASVSFTPVTAGMSNISAQFAGTGGLQAATSSSTSVAVYQRTSLVLAPANGTAGSALTLSATLTSVPAGVPLAGQTVTFSFVGAGAPIPTTALTNANGVATASVVFATPGSFTATASFFNPSGFFADPTGAFPVIADMATAQVTVAPQATITVTTSGLIYSRVSQTYTGTVTLKNTGSASVSGPFQILFTGLTANVTLVNATGMLAGTPYITVSAPVSLAPGQSVVVNVQFGDPSNATIHFTPVVQEGNINRVT